MTQRHPVSTFVVVGLAVFVLVVLLPVSVIFGSPADLVWIKTVVGAELGLLVPFLGYRTILARLANLRSWSPGSSEERRLLKRHDPIILILSITGFFFGALCPALYHL